MLVALRRGRGPPVVQVELHVRLDETWDLEGCGDGVRRGGLVEVHPMCGGPVSSMLGVKERERSLAGGTTLCHRRRRSRARGCALRGWSEYQLCCVRRRRDQRGGQSCRGDRG